MKRIVLKILGRSNAVPFVLLATSFSWAQAPQFEVKHTPYLQLGDAPLGSATDQIEILWQTLPVGPGTQDSFTVDYRSVGASPWISAGPVSTLDTGVQGRINHFVPINGLQYDTDYEYRVVHLRSGAQLTTYQSTFQSRLSGGDQTPFTFVAYGDSAHRDNIANFRSVQDRINQVDASQGVAFSLLLGDNAYPHGNHADFDARMDPTRNPELVQYGASHVDYYAMGNHDSRTQSGQPSRENYSVPRNGPAVGEPEENYTFDYGLVHFGTFDSNYAASASVLADQLDWLVADMQASSAEWKIVFAHHPVAGTPDKPANPGDNYYRQVVSRLRGAGVDLLMAGHSHMYHWTYPLLGESGGQATFVLDTDKDYKKGAGLVQLVSGVGGESLRSGNFSQIPFNAAGFSISTVPAVAFGFGQVDVTPDELTVSYIAADDGAVIDSFKISQLPALFGDVEGDGDVDAGDIDVLYANLGSTNPLYDLDLDGGAADQDDVTTLVQDILNTVYGDANLDLSVDLADLNLWLASSGGWAGADFNGDLSIDLADFNTWLSTLPAAAPLADALPTPEPSTLLWLGLGGLLAARRRPCY